MEINKFKELDNWAFNALRYVVLDPKNVDELDKQKNKYDSMTRKQKREADWMSQSLTGEDNETRYNRLKTQLSKKDIDTEKSLEYDGSGAARPIEEMVEDDVVDYSRISYPKENIQKAKDYALDAMRIIIYPTYDMDKLDDLYIKFKSQIRKHQRESDWRSIELFGIDNETHYKYLKAKYAKEDFQDSIDEKEKAKDIRKDQEKQESEPPYIINTEIIERKLDYLKNHTSINEDFEFVQEVYKELQDNKNYSIYENIIIQKYFNGEIEHFKDNVAQVVDDPYIPYIDMPFYDPEEMMSLGIFNKDTNLFSVEADNNYLSNYIAIDTKNWFDMYRINFAGFDTAGMIPINNARVNRLMELCSDIQDIMDEDKLKARKQSILELGWNPDLPFTPENRAKADNRIKDKLKAINGTTTIIDTKYLNLDNYTEAKEVSKKNILYPVYIVLVEGKRVFSSLTKKFTHSRISHAAIGFDPKLDKLYSFNAGDFVEKNKKFGGLSIEDVSKYTKDKTLEVYTIFTKEEDYKKIRKMVDSFIDNRDKLSYSYLNILTLAFNIPMNRKTKMICSQFVDRILKLCNIDITHKDSSMVTPADFENASYRNKKIYKVYDGMVGEYKGKKISDTIEKMINQVEPIKEGVSFLSEFAINIAAIPVYESKAFPVQFDKDGNLLIKNRKKLDYGSEFSKSHKLLMQYHDSKNYDGMKYELAKLWFMNNTIEDKVHNKKDKSTNSSESTIELINHRAHILGDFNKYLKEVLKAEKDFNFTSYYEETPFSDAFIRFNSSTLYFTAKTLKDIISNI